MAKTNKLGKKDTKLVLVILIILLLGVVYYQFVFLPQSQKISEMKQTKESYESRIEMIQTKIGKLPELEKKLEEEKEKIYPMAKKYFGNIDQEDLILLINDLGNKSTIDITDVSFKELESGADYGISLEEAEQKQSSNQENTNSEGQANSGNQSQAEGQNSQPPQENAEAPKEDSADLNTERYQNLKVTDVNIEFLGTYADLKQLVTLVDENAQNIVSNKLNISKRDSFRDGYNSAGKNINDYVEGGFNLRFFRVLSLDEYMPKRKSILENNIIGKSPHDSPIIGYSWALKGDTTNSISGEYLVNGTTKAINNISAMAGSLQSIQGNTTPKQVVEYKQPVEIVRFDGLKDFVFTAEENANSGTIGMDGVADINYKIIRADVEFTDNTDIDKKIFIDMSGKNLKLKERPNSISISLYSPKDTGYEMGYVFKDVNGEKVYVPFSEKISFMGWKTIETKVDNVNFPATIEAVYIKRSAQENPVNGSVYLDSIHANYIRSK